MTDQYVYGVHAVSALLTHRYRATHQIYASEDRTDRRIQDVLMLAETAGVPIQRLSSHKMDQRFPGIKHQGIVAHAAALPDYTDHALDALLATGKRLTSQIQQPPLILILDGVTDPQNLGACLRSADAAGVDFVIIPKDKNASISPVVSKVACGAAESVPLVRVTNLARVMRDLKEQGFWIYGAAGEASVSIYTLDARVPLVLVMGAEGEGMRRLTREHCDGLFSLPMLGTVASLNVSVAAGISLYEVVRQRGV